MPGKKDFVSMLVNGIKQQVQKRLILFTEYEAFLQFKECNPEVKIGFSKFAEARPKNVVLPGSAGTHNVCVCTYHQNPKLMIRNSQISSRPEFQRIAVQKGESYEGEIKYQHLLARIMCNPPSEDCWLNDCEHCEDSSRLEDELVEIFSELDIEEVSYKQWESTDRTELVTVTENTQEFVTNLVAKLQVLKVHMFIHDMQTKFFHQVKNNLSHGQVLAVGDFSEITLLLHKMLHRGFTGLTPCVPSIPGYVTITRTMKSRHSVSSSSQIVSIMTQWLCTPFRQCS